MATFGGWTEKREYRVWMGEETYATVAVEQHANGRVNAHVDGEDDIYRTNSLRDAYNYANDKAEALCEEAKASCNCGGDEDCSTANMNPYGYSHGVRIQVVDMETGYALEPWEL